QLRAPGVQSPFGEDRWGPVVVLPGAQGQFAVALLAGDDEGAGANDLAGRTWGEPLVGHLQGGVGQQPGVDGAGGLREAGLGLAEVEADGGIVDDLATLVGADLFGGGELVFRVPKAEEVEVLDDVLRVQRGAVGVGDPVAQVEGELGGVLVDLRQVGGDPWVELEGVWVLPQQPVGDVVDHAAVGVEARGRWVEVIEGEGVEVGQLGRVLLRTAGAAAGGEPAKAEDDGGEQRDHRSDGAPGAAPRRALGAWQVGGHKYSLLWVKMNRSVYKG